ncbi:MAG: thiamine pyrophosphate-binding protein [Tyzzerella sp.]|nr:thiamine pyrophosphate-binding protein [Tyzzerella sp.]
MKASDYLVEYLIKKGITDVFGYPGGMVTHLMDSFSKYSKQIESHVTYHEQGASFAACGYAQATGKMGVAYATSGPGATNLITGICNAYFDSIPALFITGQVNTFESKDNLNVRQRGFQETDIVSMVSSVTKYAIRITDAQDLKFYLDYAFYMAQEGRKGPVLLDIPMNVFRAEVNPDEMRGYAEEINDTYKEYLTEKEEDILRQALISAKRPVLLLGQGIKSAGVIELARQMVEELKIPSVSTMLSIDVIGSEWNFGFIGAYGERTANFIVAKSDLLITIGARLDVRQVGARRENFAPGAKLIRIDIDAGELEYRVQQEEIGIVADAGAALRSLQQIAKQQELNYENWVSTCCFIQKKLQGIDKRIPNELIERLGNIIPDEVVITTDVGQNQVWVAQSLRTKRNQKVLFSGGHGAMGYSLPAAIGCACGSGQTVYSFNGDGGVQMNIQELQTIARDRLPIKIVILNNYALGMIRHFQEMYFQDNYTQTVADGGYTVPDFEKLAHAYGIDYKKIRDVSDIKAEIFEGNEPAIIEVMINEKTYVFPKLEFGKPNQDQEPLLDRELYSSLMEL